MTICNLGIKVCPIIQPIFLFLHELFLHERKVIKMFDFREALSVEHVENMLCNTLLQASIWIFLRFGNSRKLINWVKNQMMACKAKIKQSHNPQILLENRIYTYVR